MVALSRSRLIHHDHHPSLAYICSLVESQDAMLYCAGVDGNDGRVLRYDDEQVSVLPRRKPC